MKLNNKKRQHSLYKNKVVVEYFRNPIKEPVDVYADNCIYMTITPQRIFYGYKLIKGIREVNPQTKAYRYRFDKSKVVKL